MQRNMLILLSDLASFWLALFILILVRFNHEPFDSVLKIHLLPFSILSATWILSFYLFDLYDLFRIKPTLPHLRRFGLALLFCLLVGVLLFYFMPIFGITPKTNLLIQLGFFGLISFAGRRIIYLIFSGQATQPVVLIGQTKYLSDLDTAIKTNPQTGLKIVAQVDTLTHALEKHGNLEKPLFIYESFNESTPNNQVIHLLKKGIEVLDVAQAYERYFDKIPISYINASWIVENIKSSKNSSYNLIVRIRDIILASIILIATIPFTLIFGVLIYAYDRKNIFYISSRIGINGKVFNCYKFRSMSTDLEKNPDADGSHAMWQSNTDLRTTPIGRIIRKLHIDEIPQMLNIILGDMALVGPRPERPYFVNLLGEHIPNYGLRHIIRPGFTGWAQIKYRYARSIDDSREKFEYDLFYIKNRNFFLDIGIMLKTLQIIFTH